MKDSLLQKCPKKYTSRRLSQSDSNSDEPNNDEVDSGAKPSVLIRSKMGYNRAIHKAKGNVGTSEWSRSRKFSRRSQRNVQVQNRNKRPIRRQLADDDSSGSDI